MKSARYLLVPCVALLAACPTSFTGDAHIAGGARGCYEQCRTAGMQMDSYVYLGEYSTACVCRPPAQPPRAASGAAASAAAVGVVMQMRSAQQQPQP